MVKKKTRLGAQSQLRIIGGQWRGRKLAVADVDGLRPTGDRIRETLFNWLQNDIRGARCLDMFAGTGALGLEALSRGAKTAVLVEQHPLAVATLTAHLKLLNIDACQCQVIQSNVIDWLNKASLPKASIDIVFLDPPFANDLWQAAIAALEQSQCLTDDAWIYIETPKQYVVELPAHWQMHREKTAGGINYALVSRHTLVS